MAATLGAAAQRPLCQIFSLPKNSKLGPKVKLDSVGRSDGEGNAPFYNLDAARTPFRDGAVTFTVDDLYSGAPPNRALSIGVRTSKTFPSYKAVVSFTYDNTGSNGKVSQVQGMLAVDSGSSCHWTIQGANVRDVTIQQVLEEPFPPRTSSR